jgi:cation transport regulator ChaB
MPYAKLSDVPQWVKDRYGSCAENWYKAFNASFAEKGEAASFKIANSAANDCLKAKK